MTINTKWTANMEDGEEFKKRLLEQKDLLERLYDIVDEWEVSNYKERMKKSHYEKKAWSEFQADATGYARALSEIKNLLKFTKE